MFKRFHHSFPVPLNTPRMQLKDGSMLILRANPEIESKSLPPLLFNRKQLPRPTEEQAQEIRELRTSAPSLWTVRRLAKKFNTHETIVMSIVDCPPERKQRLQAEADQEFNEMKPHQKRKIIDRMRRKALW